MNKIAIPLLIILLLISACDFTSPERAPAPIIEPVPVPVPVPEPVLDLSLAKYECVVLKTSKGDIALALDSELAPLSVSNFLNYTNAQFYDGTIFHRVIDDFMIQGGGFDINIKAKETYSPIGNEADNGLSNLRGTIAMARTSDPYSATAQFFINVVDNTFLDYTEKTSEGWGYAVFGKVVSGIDTVDSIRVVSTGAAAPFSKDVPIENIVINTAETIACSAAV